MLVDLHTHSTFSDGRYTPSQLVKMAAEAGIGILGITDHDSVNGIEEALNAAADAAGAPVIAKGVELGTQVGESSVHILGYNIDIHNKNLLDKIEEMRHAREKRLHRMLDKIGALGYHITVEQCDPKNRAVGRPHVAKALVKKGYFSSVEEAFDVLLKRGKPGYEPQPKLSPEESVELLHGAGGLAVLAHPAEIENLPLVNTLLSTIPFDGIEVYHPSADEKMQQCFLQMAQKYKLLVSGGSDFHGVEGRFPEQLGIFKVYAEKVNIIQKMLK